MGELYAEAGVKRKGGAKTMMMRIGLILLVFISFFASSFSPILIILPAIALVGAFYIFPRLSIEYEYVFCDGQIDFDMIMGGAKRKNALKMDFDQIEMIAPLSSHALDSYKNGNYKKKDFSSLNPDAKLYAIVGQAMKKEVGSNLMVIFEPSEKMVDCMKQKAPRKVVTY